MTVASPDTINQVDLECAERMVEVYEREVSTLPENSELKIPMTNALEHWQKIAWHIAERSGDL